MPPAPGCRASFLTFLLGAEGEIACENLELVRRGRSRARI